MRVLIVDDEPSIRKTTRVAVESAGHSASEAPNAAKALKAAESEGFDAVFLDLKLGADDGMEVLGKLMKLRPAPAVILFTAYANIATAVEAMRRGAFDFIPKPFTPDQIRSVLSKVVKAHSMERRLQALESDLASGAPKVDLESADPAMQRALQVAFRAAETQANILILGPSGTGKSVLAREIHKRSARREAAFVTVNCPSLSRELLESELFGHAKGSFTGAVAETSGKVAAADGGDPLFLDEIGEMPLEIQPKLLRLLQEREYERVGEAVPRTADVRVIAATQPGTSRPRSRQKRRFPRGRPLLPAQRDRRGPSRPARAPGRPDAPGGRRAAVLPRPERERPMSSFPAPCRKPSPGTRGPGTFASCGT